MRWLTSPFLATYARAGYYGLQYGQPSSDAYPTNVAQISMSIPTLETLLSTSNSTTNGLIYIVDMMGYMGTHFLLLHAVNGGD